ncbi:MAG: NAD-dependent epimerase/dehydratase family protein, partial [Pseudomonadota bacterium]
MSQPVPQTVLVTGATGYIARHIVAGLLKRGHSVVGSARTEARDSEVRDAIASELDGVDWQDRYRTVALDLSKDDGWDTAMEGVDALIHTASPFPLEQPKNEDEIIRPAVDGALRALKAAKAAGVNRVVMTSSTVAVAYKERPAEGSLFTEKDWSDLTHATASPYGKSKTLAERAAWDFVAEHPEINLTAINPSLVVGPPLGGDFGTSVGVIDRVYQAKDPMLPRVGFPAVDVRDVAEAHIRAFERPDTAGNRYPLAESFMWFADVASAVKEAVPGRKVPERIAPDFLIRFLSIFDKSIRTITPILGRKNIVSINAAETDLGIEFRSARTAVI